jgi:single-stranded DNA-binding protein
MYDKNQVHITGKVADISLFKDKKGMDAVNLSLKSTNKYEDIIQCNAFSSLAKLVIENVHENDPVIVIGRIMSYLKKDIHTFKIIVEKIGIELECTDD